MKINGIKQPSRKVANEKEVKRFLMERAMEIPPMYEDHACSVLMTGEEMLDSGLCDKMSKEEIEKLDLRKQYAVPGNFTRAVNHYKRMWKLARTKGPKAAVQYYDQAMRACLERKSVKIGNVQVEHDYGRPFQNF